MSNLEPLQVGVMFWTGGVLGVDATPEEIVSSVASLGVKCGQLGVHGTADIIPAEDRAMYDKFRFYFEQEILRLPEETPVIKALMTVACVVDGRPAAPPANWRCCSTTGFWNGKRT